MNIVMIIIAALGILWLIISLSKGIGIIKADFRTYKWRVWKVRWWNRYTRDFIISIGIIALGSFAFVGVSGMIIGLIASVLVSVYLQAVAAIKRRRLANGQG